VPRIPNRPSSVRNAYHVTVWPRPPPTPAPAPEKRPAPHPSPAAPPAIRAACAPTGQQATCWIVRAGERFYASNAASNTLSGFRQTRRASHEALGNTSTGAGTVDSAVTPDEHLLYVQTGGAGEVDGFRIGADGSLTPVGTVTVPGAVGGEGIVAL
jgi:hypothetical protein